MSAKLELNEEQFRALAMLAYLGSAVLTVGAGEEEEMELPEAYDEALVHLFQQAGDFGATDLVAESGDDGVTLSDDFEATALEFVENFGRQNFWASLAQGLASRDAEFMIENKHELPDGMAEDDLFHNLLHLYMGEFAENGLLNVMVAVQPDDEDEEQND